MDWDTFNERGAQRRLLREARKDRRERLMAWGAIIIGLILFWYWVTAVVWGMMTN